MAQVQLILGTIMAILGVVLIGIATAISGIISTRLPAGDTKTRLLWASALSGITAIFAIIAAIIGILFARAKGAGAKNYKGLGVAFLIAALIVLILYVTVIILVLMVRSRPEINGTNKNALTASIILIAAGFISLAIAAIVFFTMAKGKTSISGVLSLKKSS